MGGLMAILTAHEFGHYIMAMRHAVSASLPIFLPMPFPPFGTMGALIRLRSLIPDRRALLDIGAAGPLAGLMVAIPIIYWGIKLSSVVPIQETGAGMIELGDSMLYSSISYLAIGSLPVGHELVLHPLAFAGWVGILVTAINLLPIGQLDGGHVIYALFPRHSRYVSRGVHGSLVVILLFYYIGWILPVLLLFFFRGHPPTLNDREQLDIGRKLIGSVVLLFFILCFMPVPFDIGDGLFFILKRYFGV